VYNHTTTTDRRNFKHGFKLAQHTQLSNFSIFLGKQQKNACNSVISTCPISGSWSKPHW